MKCMSPAAWLTGVFIDDDDPRVRAVRAAAAACAAGLCVGGGLMLGFSAEAGVIAAGGTIALFTAIVLLAALALRSLGTRMLQGAVLTGVGAVLLCDYGMAAYVDGACVWPLLIPLLRLLRTQRAAPPSRRASSWSITSDEEPALTPLLMHLAIGLSIVWVVVREVERMMRFGLLDAGPPVLPDRAQRGTSCHSPPCAVDLLQGMVSLLCGVAVLAMEGWCYFDSAPARHGSMAGTAVSEHEVQVLETIAQLLANFDWERAEDELLILSEGMVRRDFLSALETIVSLVSELRPYIPTSLFEQPAPMLTEWDATNSMSSPTARAGMSMQVRDGSECHSPASVGETYESSVQRVPPFDTSDMAVVFTDIQGSSNTWELHPAAMKRALRLHNSIVREAIDTNMGYEVKTIGDAFMVVFGSLENALRFGIDVQKALYRAQWPRELEALPQCARDAGSCMNGLRVRVGVNAGPVDADYSQAADRWDFYGGTVNTAARIEGVSIPGVLTVPSNQARSVRNIEALAKLVELGPVSLRGIAADRHLTALVPYELLPRQKLVDTYNPSLGNSNAANECATPRSSKSLSTPRAMRAFGGRWNFGDAVVVASSNHNGSDPDGDAFSFPTSPSSCSSPQHQRSAAAAARQGSAERRGMDISKQAAPSNRLLASGHADADAQTGRSRGVEKDGVLFDSRGGGAIKRAPAARFRHGGLEAVQSATVGFVATVWDALPSASKHSDVLSPLLNAFIGRLTVALDRTQGSVVTVLSNWVVVSWGVARPSVTHHENSFRFYSLLCDVAEQTRGGVKLTLPKKAQPRAPVEPEPSVPEVYLGLCTGWALHGVVGSLQRYPTVFSPCVTVSNLLATEAQEAGKRCLCTVIRPASYPQHVQALLVPETTWAAQGADDEDLHIYTVDADALSRLVSDKLEAIRPAAGMASSAGNGGAQNPLAGDSTVAVASTNDSSPGPEDALPSDEFRLPIPPRRGEPRSPMQPTAPVEPTVSSVMSLHAAEMLVLSPDSIDNEPSRH
eukprot:TRINITY_DN5259_c0_g1_i1.p1 TRINITY_DN5259_c0_g1~~TRINITY_DN5259_c0_g1_i1.p1  ORF type:complete len:1017 (+),score=213.89 TRINITY_DN5259_c0_g1_i1:91-3141(+)